MSSPVVGHEAAKELLRESSSPVVLLEGPAGIGKAKLALQVAAESGARVEVLRSVGEGAAAEIDEAIGGWLGRNVRGGRVVVLEVGRQRLGDGFTWPHPNSMNALLKTLEEPPPKTRFFLSSSGDHLRTIESRSMRVRCRPLSEDQVVDALLGLTPSELEAEGLRGFSEDDALWAASLSSGAPGAACRALRAVDAVPRCLSLLRAAHSGDSAEVDVIVSGLLFQHSEARQTGGVSEAVGVAWLLRLWAGQVLIEGSSRVLGPEVYGAERDVDGVRYMYVCLTHASASRMPVLAVRRAMRKMTLNASGRE